jgi:hypothetical protein
MARGWHFMRPVRLSLQEFEALQICNPLNGGGRPWHSYRTQIKIGARDVWHRTSRQYQFGEPVYFATPITIVLTRESTT